MNKCESAEVPMLMRRLGSSDSGTFFARSSNGVFWNFDTLLFVPSAVWRFCEVCRYSGKLEKKRSEFVTMGWFTNLVVVMSCVAGGLVLYPVQVTDIGAAEQAAVTVSGIVRLVHLLSFATAFGTAVWASFIGGIIMFKWVPLFVAFHFLPPRKCWNGVFDFLEEEHWMYSKSSSHFLKFDRCFYNLSFADFPQID